MIDNNSRLYGPGPSDPTRSDLQYQAFPAVILTVDTERKVCTLQDLRSGLSYVEVNIMPAIGSDFESTDVFMPTQGTTCVAVPVWWRAGFQQIAILSYQFADATRAGDAIATRPIEGVEGLSNRKRGTYRKAWEGQHTTVTNTGFT